MSNNNYPQIDEIGMSTRRAFVGSGGVLAGMFLQQQSASAIPMLKTSEFEVIMRDSPYSIQVVEFSGPKSETVTVRLVDGTSFGIKDVVESSIDPRSPLKIAATCRENQVKTRFVDLESFLSTTPKKKTLYTNERVQVAQQKEREKAERLRKDEEERLEALRRLDEQEKATTSVE